VTRHAYYNCLTRDGSPIAWNPPEPPSAWVWGESVFFGRLFALLDEQLPEPPLTFYLTSSNDHLPSYGPNVVAVVVADELARIPAYATRVGAVFKNHGLMPRLGCRPLHEPSLVNLRSLLIFLGRCIRYFPTALAYVVPRVGAAVTGGSRARLHEIPVGTHNQRDLPVPSMSERSLDVFFGGSIVQGHLPGTPRPPLWESAREWIGPKGAARRDMVKNLRKAQETVPGLRAEVMEARSYLDAYDADPDVYSRKLLDAKISLVPRGTSPQTFRFFQSLRAGCVVITDALPSQWFFTGAPVTRIKRWNELPRTLEVLLSDPALLARRHRESLDWWHSRCSEQAVAAYIVDRLTRPRR
jgi:hypothetical protein